MKSLKESISGEIYQKKSNNLNEAQETTYHVTFANAYDRSGSTYEVKITVDKKHQKEFEEFIEDNFYNIFADAWGGNLEIEPN
jgi:hypothetical protein